MAQSDRGLAPGNAGEPVTTPANKKEVFNMPRHYQQTADSYGKFTVATHIERELFDFLRAKSNETGKPIAQLLREMLFREMESAGDVF